MPKSIETPDRSHQYPEYPGSHSSRRKQRRRGEELAERELSRQLAISRRRMFQFGAPMFVLAATGAMIVGGYEIFDKNFSEKSVISKEAERLGIKRSEEESDLWKTGPQPTLSYPVVQNQETLLEATNRFNRTLGLMKQSKNPFYQNSIQLSDMLRATNQLRFELVPPTGMRSREFSMQTRSVFRYGTNLWILEVAAGWIINKLTSPQVALYFVHELEHINNESKALQELLARNPNVTDAQKTNLINSRHSNQQEAVAEESRGYGVSAQAFIWHSGLTGEIPQTPNTDDLKRVVRFIKFGGRVDSPGWQNYVRQFM